MQFGRVILLGLGVVAVAGLAGRGRVEAKDRTVLFAGQKSSSSVSTLQVYSRETLVDVTVVDAKGRPVHGLTQSDFIVEEDGKAQAIRSFQEFGSAMPVVERTLPKLPPDVYTNVQAAPVSGAVTIFLMDSLNVPPPLQDFMKRETLKYLKEMPAGAQVAILELSNAGLRVVQGFTSTGADAAASLATLTQDKSIYPSTMRNPMTLAALHQIAAYASGIKGRKNLIWDQAGITLNVGPAMPSDVELRRGYAKTDLNTEEYTDYSGELRKEFDQLTAAQVAVYPISPRGVGPMIPREVLLAEAMAEATGGVAYRETNDFKGAVANAIENGSNYYGLSYVPPIRDRDGEYHTIKVKVDQPGLRLAYRPGYTVDDSAHKTAVAAGTRAGVPAQQDGSDIAAAMGRGVPDASEVLFSVKMVPVGDIAAPGSKVLGSLDPKFAGKALRRYVLHFSLPGRQIAVTDMPGGGHKGSLEFDIVAYDVDGNVVTRLNQAMTLPLTAEHYKQLQGSPFQVVQEIDLPPGSMFVRVGVVDAVADKVGTLEISLTVAKGAMVEVGR